MIDALLGDDALRLALRQLHGGDHVGDSLARAAWSVIAEPGDGVAGALIGALGAEGALRHALSLDRLGRARTAHSDMITALEPRTQRSLAEARARWMPRADPQRVREAVLGAVEVGARLVIPGDEHWPFSFDDLGPHAPAALWVRGDPRLFVQEPRVSMVGARASSGYGDLVAAEMAGDLAESGAVIVSGGAYGIDGAAHRAALAIGGKTVAFLAGGVDRAYPAGHHGLLRQIAREGAVVSEVPCGAAPTKWRFLARNRLIAALGQAVVVVEAGWRSGSLNTAGHAATLGRAIGSVPGPVTSPSSAGCHRLLREYDATCVTSAAEVRELLGITSTAASAERAGSDPERVRLMDALSTRASVSSTELARRAGLSEERVHALLGLLELEGAIHRSGSGWRATAAAKGEAL
ncbi:MAG: DNA-processing protein DprA [Candidatus Microbacterium colombiense]|nr:MAG: DNA-processing protein DprA [Microbacterium sp.]